MNPVLRIFITDACPGCEEAQRIAAWVAQNYARLGVELVDMNAPEAIIPEAVFATPTYMLKDRIVSLGNPSLAEVEQWLKEVSDQSAR